MSFHGLKAVAIQFSWCGRHVFCSCYYFAFFHFSLFTFHSSLFTSHELPRLESRGNSIFMAWAPCFLLMLLLRLFLLFMLRLRSAHRFSLFTFLLSLSLRLRLFSFFTLRFSLLTAHCYLLTSNLNSFHSFPSWYIIALPSGNCLKVS